MIPQHVYCGFVSDQNDNLSDQNDNQCGCRMCIPIGAEWTELSNTEKLAKMIILKAQIAAETIENKTKF